MLRSREITEERDELESIAAEIAMEERKMTTYHATLTYNREYFNRTIQATVPEGWRIDISNPPYNWNMCYDSGDTKREAIDNMIAQLSEEGIHGKLSIS
jgi:hypothetical protein